MQVESSGFTVPQRVDLPSPHISAPPKTGPLTPDFTVIVDNHLIAKTQTGIYEDGTAYSTLNCEARMPLASIDRTVEDLHRIIFGKPLNLEDEAARKNVHIELKIFESTTNESPCPYPDCNMPGCKLAIHSSTKTVTGTLDDKKIYSMYQKFTKDPTKTSSIRFDVVDESDPEGYFAFTVKKGFGHSQIATSIELTQEGEYQTWNDELREWVIDNDLAAQYAPIGIAQNHP